MFDDDSEALSGEPLGALHRQWQALSKERNVPKEVPLGYNADGRLASRPKGSPLRPGSCVAMLDKGLPLPAP